MILFAVGGVALVGLVCVAMVLGYKMGAEAARASNCWNCSAQSRR